MLREMFVPKIIANSNLKDTGGNMTTLTGIIQYKIFAEGTKSESSRPYIVLENGSQILLYKKNDNPFENIGFSSYEGQKVLVEGELLNGTFVVENITQHFTENPKVTESSEETEIEEKEEK